MTNKVKIKISEQAYEELINILKDCPEFSRIRFKYKDGCCGSTKLEILLDNYRTEDIEDKIDALQIVYDLEVVENIEEISVVYRNSSFMLKIISKNAKIRDCSTCKVGCKNGGSSHCSGGCSNQKNKDG